MPYKITKNAALRQLEKENYSSDSCLICQLNQKHPWVLWEDELLRVVLSQFPSRWGHCMVLLKQHLTKFSELSPQIWAALNHAALEVAQRLEQRLKIKRSYIASLGTIENQVSMSSPHFHIHIIPLYANTDKPSNIFSWKHGIYTATETEWLDLYNTLKS